MAGKCSKSVVIKYFKEVEGTQKLICQVKNKDGSTCNVRMSAKTSNLKQHLERQHKAAFKWVKEQACKKYTRRTTQSLQVGNLHFHNIFLIKKFQFQ